MSDTAVYGPMDDGTSTNLEIASSPDSTAWLLYSSRLFDFLLRVGLICYASLVFLLFFMHSVSITAPPAGIIRRH